MIALTDPGGGDTETVTVEQGGVALANPEKGALSARTIYKRDAPGVVFIRAGQATGSGFVIGRGGSIVTNAHVVGDTKTVTVKFSDARSRRRRSPAPTPRRTSRCCSSIPTASTCTRSRSAPPRTSPSATRRWRSATRSASSARSRPA